MKSYRQKLKVLNDRKEYWLKVLRQAQLLGVDEFPFSRLIPLPERSMGQVRVAFAFLKYFESFSGADRIRKVLSRVEGRFESKDTQRARLSSELSRDLEFIGCHHFDWEDVLECTLEIAHASDLLGVDSAADSHRSDSIVDPDFALDSILDRAALLINFLNIGVATQTMKVEYDRIEEAVERQSRAIQRETEEAFEKFSDTSFSALYQKFLSKQCNPTWLSSDSREDQEFSRLWKPYMKNIEERREMIQETVYRMLPEQVGDMPNIPGMLGRLQEVLDNLQDYGDLVEEVLSGSGADWANNLPHPDSMLGNSEPINVIPSNGIEGPCRRTLLAMARGRGRRPGSFEAVLREVRRHLIDCDCTRFVILLTDRWAPDEFEEHRQDIEAHRRRGVIFLPILVTGNTLNALSI